MAGKRVVKQSKKTKRLDVDGAMGIHLQEEIIMDILSRLPVRPVFRFKCVSKFWMTLISESYFTMKHLNRAINNLSSQKILFISQRNGEFSLYCSSLSSVRLFEDIQKLDWPSNRKPWSCRLYCCYNGLALIGIGNYPEYKHHILLLWNPSTGESIVLPDPSFSPKRLYICGLGYDLTSDDYKILKIDGASRNEIITLKSGSWRKIEKHPIGVYPVLTDMDSLAFVHGAFHWLDSSLNNSVVSFSISNEVYGEIPLPEGMSLDGFNMDNIIYGVSVFEGMLCVYSTHIRKYTLWVMKDYGVKESWYQLFTKQGTDGYSIIPKYRFSDGEVLLCCRNLLRTDSVFKTSKESSDLWPQSDLERIQNGFVYTESLISPKLLT
ncbi:F-box/kelch-repeat protein At3g06240-like [Lycium barbarum]|uniref:F-box/kelch-repeat protein At3g06240-like n=1 Tax=Lycium barbarum TaxID=112863 RepID=UPI00293EE75F|nr:F-box/kelch-repeat protein At3g06240-like [Lycium barbarum]